jgi:hypothetical protein
MQQMNYDESAELGELNDNEVSYIIHGGEAEPIINGGGGEQQEVLVSTNCV